MPRKRDIDESMMTSEGSFVQNFEYNKPKKIQDEQLIKQILEDTEIE